MTYTIPAVKTAIKEGTILVKLNQTTEYLEREAKEESIESTTVQRL